MACKECEKRGQTWSGSAPRCAFESGEFNSNNWNCATINKLRGDAFEEQENSYYLNDDNLKVIPFEYNGWIVLSWYKSRGRCDVASIINSNGIRNLTLEEAECALLNLP
jgi:hypothetical protein